MRPVWQDEHDHFGEERMKTFLACFGAAHIAATFIGAFGFIDYHLCIKGPGECRIEAAHNIKGDA